MRRISASIFAVIYVLFLAWYDGWGSDPLTKAEVDGLMANVPDVSNVRGFANNLRQFGYEDDGEPFFMLNLNRYDYAEGVSRDNPPASYQAYSEAVLPMVVSNAGHPVYSAQFPDYPFVGNGSADVWHDVILVRYRSRRDFIEMVTSDAYQKIAQVRAGGIAYAEVTPTMPQLNLAMPKLLVLLFVVLLGWGVDRLFFRR